MRNHLRTNKEINPTIMPIGWSGEKESACFTIYVSPTERTSLMAKFAVYRNRVYKSEVVGYLISNYIAYHFEKEYDPFAMKVLKFGNLYTEPIEGYVNYSIGSMARTFHTVVRESLNRLPIKRANALFYYAVSAFCNAPEKVIDKLCLEIDRIKNPVTRAEKFLILQTELPDRDFQLIKEYAANTGMTVCELMRTVLKTVCISKRERAENCSAIARLFNLYRIMKQPGHPFPGTNGATLNILVLDENDKKYLLKFIKRRGLSRKELLRKAVRALIYVISYKSRFERRIQYSPEVLPDEDDYYFDHLSKIDFARNIYSRCL